MTAEQEELLLTIARASIARSLGLATADVELPEKDDWLHEPGACFVTLKINGRLRGCIGSLEAHRPLLEDIQRNAQASAFRDPRFPPLTPEEFERIRIEISLLTHPEPLAAVADETAVIAMLQPGRDGVLLQYGSHRATFLPQVWEELPDPRQFLAHLKLKAGLPPDFWHPEMLLSVYRVEKLTENEPTPPAEKTG